MSGPYEQGGNKRKVERKRDKQKQLGKSARELQKRRGKRRKCVIEVAKGRNNVAIALESCRNREDNEERLKQSGRGVRESGLERESEKERKRVKE